VNAATKLSAFGLAVVVTFAGAWAAGRLSGPAEPAPAAEQGQPGDAQHGAEDQRHDEPAGHGSPASGALPGLASSEHGYRLVVESATLAAGAPHEFRFRIADQADAPVTRFAVEHDKLMHLVVVRRDGAHYQHVHPDLGPDGTWSVPLTLAAAGSYRVFADFRPDGGERTTLGVDVHVPGDYRPASFDGESRTFDVDGYQVRLDGTAGALTATVTRAGQPVTDLEPYLGAYGHLVALRTGDLAYLHVHPRESATAGPQVGFDVEFPTAGRYRLFLDFQHGGVVRTAEFTLDTAGAGR
jgi:hypothetical protein